jgi:hypothetical protein
VLPNIKLRAERCFIYVIDGNATCVSIYNKVLVGKNLSDMFPIRHGLKQGDALSPFLYKFALEYAIRRVQENQHGLKLHGTHQLPAYADDVNILGGSIHTVKENTKALVVATKEADKTKYMVMS